jgi:hypothetical protein
MTWTYSPSEGRPLDSVRLYCGDTDPNDQLLQDEELGWILSDEGNDVMRAAVTACDTLAAKYTRRASSGGQQNGELAAHFMALAARLRRKMARQGVSLFVGGQSIAAKQSATSNPDQVLPSFTRDMMSEPSTTPNDTRDDGNWAPFPY